MLTEKEVQEIKYEVNKAKDHLDIVAHIADGKDDNTAFLALYNKERLDVIVKSAQLKEHNNWED